MEFLGIFLFLSLPLLVNTLDSVVTEHAFSIHKTSDNDGVIIDETVTEEYIPDGSSSNEDNSSSNIKIDSSYIDDFKSMGDKMDKNKTYTVRAMLPIGELLVLGTPTGCALLDSSDDESNSNPLEPMEFTFKVSDLEDCGKLTDLILDNLQSEIMSQWNEINGKKTCKSFTTMQDISIRKRGLSSETTETDEDFDSFKSKVSSSMDGDSDELKKMATAFLATHLSVDLLPTTLEGAYVFHFNIVDDEKVDSKFNELLNLLNKTPEELKKIQDEYKSKLEETKNILSQEISQGKIILDELSQHGIDTVECYNLSKDDCNKYSKCAVVSINGEERCFVSPKTIFWLLETNCGLQSKSALSTIAKDLVSAKIMSESQYETLRQSYDLNHICNSITHSYLSSDIPIDQDHPSKKAFEL